MRLSAKFILQIIAVSTLGGLAGWGFSRYARGDQPAVEVGDGKYDFDAALDSSLPGEVRLDHGQRLGLVIGISKFSQPSEYLGVLQRKYGNEGLRILVVFAPDSARGNILMAKSIGVPSVVDKDGWFQLLLRSALTHRHDAILVYDDSYRVKFHALAMPDNDLLRQLVEKYLVGKITYSSASLLASSLVGKRVVGLQCLMGPPPSGGIFVVFPPGCSSCELNSYRELLKKARQSSWVSRDSDGKWTLVFVNGRDPHTLAAARDLGLEVGDVCGVREDSLLDPYQTRKNSTTVPLLLRAGKDGIVDDVQELRSVANGGVQ